MHSIQMKSNEYSHESPGRYEATQSLTLSLQSGKGIGRREL